MMGVKYDAASASAPIVQVIAPGLVKEEVLSEIVGSPLATR